MAVDLPPEAEAQVQASAADPPSAAAVPEFADPFDGPDPEAGWTRGDDGRYTRPIANADLPPDDCSFAGAKDGSVSEIWREDGVPSYLIGDQGPQPEMVQPETPWQPREVPPEERSGMDTVSPEHRDAIRGWVTSEDAAAGTPGGAWLPIGDTGYQARRVSDAEFEKLQEGDGTFFVPQDTVWQVQPPEGLGRPYHLIAGEGPPDTAES